MKSGGLFLIYIADKEAHRLPLKLAVCCALQLGKFSFAALREFIYFARENLHSFLKQLKLNKN